MAASTGHSIRVYADTSVFGGVFDEEFAMGSKAFFDQVTSGRYRLITSPLLREELGEAPAEVRAWYEKFVLVSEEVPVTDEAVLLQQAYLNAGIVSKKWEADALHVAIASVSDCRLVVSWNFKHIVSFQKIPLYNGVNLTRGFNSIAIHTPDEVTADEDENV